MTAREIVAACDTAGIRLWVTGAGKLGFRPTPAPDLIALLKANRDEVLSYLRDPDQQGWVMPPEEPLEAARARRDALWRPITVNIGRPGLGPSFIAEQRRLAELGLVVLEDYAEEPVGRHRGTEAAPPAQTEEPGDLGAFLAEEPPFTAWVRVRDRNAA